MTRNQLQEIAMTIASGHTTTEYFTWDAFYNGRVDLSAIAWGPYEHWPIKDYENEIAGLAEGIVRNFEHLISKG